MTAPVAPNESPAKPAGWLLEIELKRIQPSLFAVPRLPVMVGANALLGETLRGLWTGKGFDADRPSLPTLAQDCQAGWPAGARAAGAAGASAAADPLHSEGIWQDDVARVAETAGILTRDGGHFEAVFPHEEDTSAKAFLARAWELIQQQLPGIVLSAHLTPVYWDDAQRIYRKAKPAAAGPKTPVSVLDLAQAEVCEYSGQGPASERLKVGPEPTPAVVSKAVADRFRRGRAFDAGDTRDILGILRPALLQDLGFGPGDDKAFPSEFTQLAIHGYLAVVHVDGNSVGSRFRAYNEPWAHGEDLIAAWRHREAFFHALRVGVRRAVRHALRQVFRGWRTRNEQAPLRLLMLGGDDLTLVCGAPFALPFLVALAQQIQITTADLPNGPGAPPSPLTLGAGAALVQDSFPFHRAYELAEDLAASAKRLKASLPPEAGNVVDWIVTAEAWHGDIEATRRDHAVIDGELILSGKPYRILNPAAAGRGARSLQEMLADAQRLAERTRQDRLARSQLQALARSLPQGRHTARFAAAILPKNLAAELRHLGYLSPDQGPWTALPDGHRSQSPILDLLELYELEMLRQEAERTGALTKVDLPSGGKNDE